MKPSTFSYHAPTTLEEAVTTLSELGDTAKVLAGGQSLVPMLALRLARFDHLIDLNNVPELSYVQRDNGRVRIGAMTRQSMLERDPLVKDQLPLLARATPLIAHFQIRNRGTIGGSIAHADPASEYPAVSLALGATMELTRRDGQRALDAARFFQGTWTTDARDDELLTAITFPVRGSGSGFAIKEIARRHGDFAIAGVACALRVDDQDRIRHAAISFFGVGSTAVLSVTAEQALLGHRADEIDHREIGSVAARDLEPPDDIHASGSYRRKVSAVLVERALAAALEEARGSRHV